MSSIASTHFGGARSASRQSIPIQRWGSWIGGGALVAFGLIRRSTTGFILAGAGGALAYYGTKAGARKREMDASSTVLLNCSPAEAFRFWRNFENLPRFMHHLENVTVTDKRRSKWTAIGPLNTRLQWDAEIVDERDGEFISWRSLPGSDLTIDGSVEFRIAPANRGTYVKAITHITPPAGILGRAVAKIFGKDPNFLMRQDMRRFKALIEAGEVPTVEGQSHGPRDFGTAVARLVNPDESIKGEGSAADAMSAKRRAS